MKEEEVRLLIDNATRDEKRYDWKDAAQLYEEAYAQSLKEKEIQKAAEIQEKLGFSLYRAAFQEETNNDFLKMIRQSVKAYELAIELHKKTGQDEESPHVRQSKAMKAFASSWLEVEYEKMASLLDEWWNLEKDLLKHYENKGDFLAVGTICNDMLEGSFKNRFHLIPEWPDLVKATYECFGIGEKALKALSRIDNEYELARAYLWAGWYYSFAFWFRASEDRLKEFSQRSVNYSKKALELSEKIGDDWLIAWSCHNARFVSVSVKFNPESARKLGEKASEHGAVTRDKHVLAEISGWTALTQIGRARTEIGPEEKREGFRKALKSIQDSRYYYQVINNPSTVVQVYGNYVVILLELASLETSFEEKHALLKKAVKLGKEFLAENLNEITNAVSHLSTAIERLSQITLIEDERKKLLDEATDYRLKHLDYLQRQISQDHFSKGIAYFNLALIKSEQATLEKDETRKIELLKKAAEEIEECKKQVEIDSNLAELGVRAGVYGTFYYVFGEILSRLYTHTKEQNSLLKALDFCSSATELFSIAANPSRKAECQWRSAMIHGQLGKHSKASENYCLAAESYKLAGQKIPQLKEFFEHYSDYMKAWSHIEQAKLDHIAEKFEEAKTHYEEAARLHMTSKLWNYLATNYKALAKMEEADGLSRKEETQQAKQSFQQALELFKKSEEHIRTKLLDITDPEERKQAQKLINASKIRLRYCQARIEIEEAKILDRKGEHNQSSKAYDTAIENLNRVVEEIESEEEKDEVKAMMKLCQAWQKLEQAEDKANPQTYQEAAELFEEAKDYSYNKKTTLLAMGNSSFCKGLAAGTRYHMSLEPSDRSSAALNLERAVTYYQQAGFTVASEYAKGTLRLFDAYMYMNNAQAETDPEKKAKNYTMAEKLLQIAAGSFNRANQPEREAQAQTMLERIKEEKSLAISFNELFQSPDIMSSTASFITPTSPSEEAVGLQRFDHADIQTNLFLSAPQVRVAENLSLEIQFLNVGKEGALLMQVENIVPEGFMVVDMPSIYRIEESSLNMKGKMIPPFKTEEVKMTIQPKKEGIFHLNPKLHFLNELGRTQSLQFDHLTVKVDEVTEPDRLVTGTRELDALLLGGIPERYAVVLTAPPSEERSLLVRNFLETGAANGQVTFQVTAEGTGLEDLADTCQSKLFIFICNPKPAFELPDLPNVYKLRSKTDLTNLNIQLLKANRIAEQRSQGLKRLCIDITSDVLLHHGAEVTRRWISELVTDLKSKGFTVLMIVNPLMHPSEQLNAITDLLDGEIDLHEGQGVLPRKTLQIKKLIRKDFIKNPVYLIL